MKRTNALLGFLCLSAVACSEHHPHSTDEADDAVISDGQSDPTIDGTQDESGEDRTVVDVGEDGPVVTPPDAGGDQGSEPDVPTFHCAVHSDCPCGDGVCLSTGECHCPPCEEDADCWDGLSCWHGVCTTIPEECVGPPRIRPDRGPETGGTLFWVEGMEFYIGALEWLGQVGDGPVLWPVWSLGMGVCSMPFISPPMEPGTYPVRVGYGGIGEPDNPRGADPAGMFTYEASDETVGHGFCRGHAQCEDPIEVCDLGLGRCVPNLCLSMQCRESACDPIQGCVADACESDADCTLLHNDCGCDSEPSARADEPLSDCHLGGCDVCDTSHCEIEYIEAVCVAGVCTERRGDPEGAGCDALEWREITGAITELGFASDLDLAENDGRIALSWNQNTERWRYGDIRLATFTLDRIDAANFAILDSTGRGSNTSVAATEDGFGVLWLSEHPSPAKLMFQSFDEMAQSQGEARVIDQRIDESISSHLLSDGDGVAAFWMQKNWGEDDGLYHANLAADGALVGDITHISWISGDLDRFSVADLGDNYAIAWNGEIGRSEGIMTTPFPIADGPVLLVSEEGSGVAIAGSDFGSGLSWSNSGSTGRGVSFQSFDRDGQALIAPASITRADVWNGQLTKLGPWYVSSWLQRVEGVDEPNLQTVAFRDDGRVLAENVLTLEERTGWESAQIGLAESILVVWIERGGSGDSFRFGEWRCVAND